MSGENSNRAIQLLQSEYGRSALCRSTAVVVCQRLSAEKLISYPEVRALAQHCPPVQVEPQRICPYQWKAAPMAGPFMLSLPNFSPDLKR